jgi:hypothetical protein
VCEIYLVCDKTLPERLKAYKFQSTNFVDSLPLSSETEGKYIRYSKWISTAV